VLTTALIEHVLAAIPGKTVGLVGDLFLDRYLDIDPARDEPSVETGLVAHQVTAVRAYPGALGTVTNNLSALGVGRIVPVSVIGDDGEGYELRQALARLPGVESGGMVSAADRRTPTYTKPMRGGVELNRLDIKNRTPTPRRYEDQVIARLEARWPDFDALLVLDQVSEVDCGVVTARVRDRIGELAAADPDKFVLADSREQIELFRNVCIKPNHDEVSAAVRRNGLNRPAFPGIRTMFHTAGARGIFVEDEATRTPRLIPAYPVTGPIDVCGAGDSCSAAIAAAVAAGLTFEHAAAFGNLIASITVQQIGTTGTAPPDKVRQRWREVGGTESAG
jgi:bifunctional ADP-heptose synthase (sugar kinase/adenylyltransferase)